MLASRCETAYNLCRSLALHANDLRYDLISIHCTGAGLSVVEADLLAAEAPR